MTENLIWAWSSSASALSQLVERPGPGHRQQLQGRVVGAGLVLALRRCQRALGAPCRVGRQLGRALTERGGRRQAATRLRPARRSLELRGDVLVEARRRVRAMPGAAVGIQLRVRGVGQRPVDGLASVRRGAR